MSEDTKNEGNDLLNEDLDQDESQDQSSEANTSDDAGADTDQPDQNEPATDEDEPSQENPAQETVPEPTPARASTKDVGISYQKMTEDMKEHLATQQKVHFMIPLGEGEKDGAYETVQINGYKMTIKKGTMVVIPQQVAEILADHYRISSEVGQEWRIDRDNATEKALV